MDLNTSTIAPNVPMLSRNEGARLAVSKSELLMSPQMKESGYIKSKTNLIGKTNRPNNKKTVQLSSQQSAIASSLELEDEGPDMLVLPVRNLQTLNLKEFDKKPAKDAVSRYSAITSKQQDEYNSFLVPPVGVPSPKKEQNHPYNKRDQ